MLVPDHELALGEDGEQRWHRETVAIESVAFQHRLQAAHMALFGESVSRHTLEEVAFAVAAKARSQGKEQEVFVRVAFFDGAVWLDLGDREWHAMRITAEGWEVVADCPVAFRRTTGMLALPTPVRGGNINELQPFVNVASDTDFRLAVAWWSRSPAWAERLFSRQPFPAVPLLAGGVFPVCLPCLRLTLLCFGEWFGNGCGTAWNGCSVASRTSPAGW
jgi:hypothetical protein